MELLLSNLSHVRVPEPMDRIYKQECCVSFDTPKSEGGLFVDLYNFIAFGKDYVSWNYEKTRDPVYLHIKQTQKPVAEDRPSKRPTLLSRGTDGGFDNNEPEYEESYEIVILPDYVTLSYPSAKLPEKVRLAVDALLLAEGAERKEQVAQWSSYKMNVSKYAWNLKQLDNGVIVPPSGWKCANCDETENLWLNLTDGSILCGVQKSDGTDGNDHALNHYYMTAYPLAVKLGTISADLEAADVFSYPEGEIVKDPLLAEHLAHFRIDFSSLHGTEITTAELEPDQNTNFDWNRIQESGKDMEPLYGPGYTGLINLGNRYFTDQTLKTAFDTALADPTVDLNMQLTKLAHGLLSGKYSLPATEANVCSDAANSTKQVAIAPRMFKSIIAANHPEFSGLRQQSYPTFLRLPSLLTNSDFQDALEYFLHLMGRVEQINSNMPANDPSRSFRFGIEERLQCPSGQVTYNRRSDYILSLNIPLHKATNKKEFEKFKAEKANEGEKLLTKGTVRPRIQLKDCLECFASPEEVHDFFSTALKSKTTAIKTAGLTSFPDYLVVQMQKFVLGDDWEPKKLDVYVDVPEIIDISNMCCKSLHQPGERLLPEAADEEKILADENIVAQLTSMGFYYLHCQKAAINTLNRGVDEATNWLLEHMNDPDINTPISNKSKSSDDQCSFIGQSKIDALVSIGFQEELAKKALKATGGDVEKATNWIVEYPYASSPSDINTSTTSNVGSEFLYDVEITVPKIYKLIGIVSHMGTSTHMGHYVAHIRKNGRWTIFNDDKVAVSKDPPLDMGYLYFFERLNDLDVSTAEKLLS